VAIGSSCVSSDYMITPLTRGLPYRTSVRLRPRLGACATVTARAAAKASTRRPAGPPPRLGGGLLRSAEPRIERVAHTVADQVEAQDGERDRESRPVDEPRPAGEELRRAVQHVPPRRHGRPDSGPEV